MHGIDACKVAKLSKATTVLENVAKDDRTCNICHKGLAGAQSLKNHIRAEHVGKKKHYCKPCDQYFAEASGLKIHNRKHGIGAMFPCTKCPKQFPSVGRLNEHKRSHISASERSDAKCEIVASCYILGRYFTFNCLAIKSQPRWCFGSKSFYCFLPKV